MRHDVSVKDALMEVSVDCSDNIEPIEVLFLNLSLTTMIQVATIVLFLVLSFTLFLHDMMEKYIDRQDLKDFKPLEVRKDRKKMEPSE